MGGSKDPTGLFCPTQPEGQWVSGVCHDAGGRVGRTSELVISNGRGLQDATGTPVVEDTNL